MIHMTNMPKVLAEVAAVFAHYEDALVHNKVEVLDALFWNSPHTVRYGTGENLYGFDAIQAFRAARKGPGPRAILKTAITTYGYDFATTNIEFQREGSDQVGRQSQTWLRTESGWKVVSAHVSVMA